MDKSIIESLETVESLVQQINEHYNGEKSAYSLQFYQRSIPFSMKIKVQRFGKDELVLFEQNMKTTQSIESCIDLAVQFLIGYWNGLQFHSKY